MKELIIKLRSEGKTYNEIKQITGASKGTIAFHCNIEVRKKQYKRNLDSKKDRMSKLRESYGAKCCICNYDRCLEALDFHHVFPNNKNKGIADLMNKRGIKEVIKEAEKCILLCANCHREMHAGLIAVETWEQLDSNQQSLQL